MNAMTTFSTLFAIVCGFQFYGQVSSTKTITQFKCSTMCAPSTDSWILPHVTLIRRSRLACSSSCSNTAWCLKYIFTYLRSCLLFFSAEASCPTELAGLSGSQISVCVKVSDMVTAPCRMTRRVVLENGANKVDNESLLQMLYVGNDLKFLFSSTNWTNLAAYNSYVIPSNMAPLISASAPAYSTNVSQSKIGLIVRNFTSNAIGVLEEQYNSQPSNTLATPNFTQWIVQRRCANNFGNKMKVYSTSGSTVALKVALDNGQSINFLLMGSNIRYVTANAVIRDGNTVYAQAFYYEMKKIKFVTVGTSGSPYMVTWDYINKVRYELEAVGSEYTWYADPCWTAVATTTITNNIGYQQLKVAVLSGKNVRVKFNAGGLDLYMRPVYVGINDTDIITIHVTNYIKRGSLPSIKVHYILSTDGYMQEFTVGFGSDSVNVIDSTSSIDWFTDDQNFSLLHITTFGAPTNLTTLSRLKEKVTSGNEVKVRLYRSSNGAHCFPCETLQISSDGSLIQCHVTGQLAVNYFGNTSFTQSVTQSGGFLGGLGCTLLGCPTTTTITYVPTVTSGCPQFLTINTNGQMTSTVSCLEYDATFKNHTNWNVNVDWLVAD